MPTLNTGVTLHNTDFSTPSYSLFSPMGGEEVFLVDHEGTVAHKWSVGHGFTFWCTLLPNGNLFVNERVIPPKFNWICK